MKLNFFKMQAQGNDYIYFDLINQPLPEIDLNNLASKLSNRYTGIGGDGIVLLLPTSKADVFMRIFNADGSEATSCGSALRCVTAYLGKLLQKNRIKIETLSGQKFGTILENDTIKVNLGHPKLIQDNYKVDALEGSLVQLGNYHFVVRTGSLPDLPELKKAFNLCQNDPALSNSNLEFYKIKSANEIEIKIWEKGSGPTLACGTGAGAAAFSGLLSGLLRSPVKVCMPGGEVSVEFTHPDIFLKGKVEFVFNGDIII